MRNNRIPRTIKYLILGIGIALVVALGQGWLQVVSAQASQEQQAQALTQQGHALLGQGRAESALQTWQQATELYRKLHNQEGVAGSLLNQSLALEYLGQLSRACTTLLEPLRLEKEVWLCDPLFNLPPKQPMQSLKQALEHSPASSAFITDLGLQKLGSILRQMGQLQESELILLKALNLSDNSASNPDQSRILLSLGNTERTFYDQAQEQYAIVEDLALQQALLTTLENKAHSALKYYQQSSSGASQPIQLQAQYNALDLLIAAQQWAAANQSSEPGLEAFQAEMQRQIPALLEQLQQNSAAFNQLSPAEAVYLRLDFATSLAKLHRKAEATQQAQQALQIAQALNNPKLESNSLGVLGQLSEAPQEAQAYLEQALRLSESAPEIAYQWQHELGRLYRQQGELQKATQAYQQAIGNLDQVRGDLSALNPDLQFSFQERIVPVYREYMQLLLSVPQPELERVIQTNERLQLAELENFLQCGKLDLISLDQLQNQGNPPAIVHVISLADQYEVIVRSPDGAWHRYTPNPEQFKTSIDNLLALVQDSHFLDTDQQTIQAKGQALYQLLLEPARERGDIPPTGTLVFNLDSALQNIPISLLHDGKNYLVHSYSPALALGAQLRQPKHLHQNELRALIAGLSQRSPSLDAPNAPPGLQPLPQTRKEAAIVKESVKSSAALLDQAFTAQRLEAELAGGRYPILHISTHGKFSSNPQQTVLLDWNQAINVQQLDKLLKGSLQGEEASLELLVLSACETAKGDQRATLGLAGIAAQAGARSTLASLWQVDAASTAQLMEGFYEALKAGTPKAEAVRQAQLALLENPGSSHPYFWSGFILVGSWL